MTHETLTTTEQPTWCCKACGEEFGRWYLTGTYQGPLQHVATWHTGTCDVCLRHEIEVTEPRDFGYLGRAWDKKTRYVLGRA